MFADSLLSTDRSRRGWTTLASFALQAVGLTVLFALPLLYTEGLPQLHLRDWLLGPPAAITARSVPHAVTQNLAILAAPTGALRPARRVPLSAYTGPDFAAAPAIPLGGTSLGIDHAAGGGNTSGISRLFSTPLPPAPVAQPARVPPVSRWMEANLVRKIQPVYPAPARSTGIQGSVVLRALIGRDGRIEQVNVIHGHPWLVKAAVDAVSQWLYRPYFLNGQAVEVDTEITVNFILAR